MEKGAPITAKGLEQLQKELKQLKSTERPAILQAISDARRHGDLSENAEYHAAKEKQGYIERRITQIGKKIATARVIDISALSGSKICFGAKVTIKDEESGACKTYQIVGEAEANIEKGLLSCYSLLGKELIGKECGANFELNTPGGEKFYTIENVEYSAE